MALMWIIVVILLLGLALMAWAYKRSRQAAQAIEAKFKKQQLILRQSAASTQDKLGQRLETKTQEFLSIQQEKADLNEMLASLRQQCQTLESRLAEQAQQVRQETNTETFEHLKTLMTQYPGLRRMTDSNPDFPAGKVVDLLTPLENLSQFWNYQPIGSPWETVAYDPKCHQGDVDNLGVGESVYVKFVGYRQGDRILTPAQVTRTNPEEGLEETN